MKRIGTKFIPRLLKEDQIQSRANACRELKERLMMKFVAAKYADAEEVKQKHWMRYKTIFQEIYHCLKQWKTLLS